MIKRLGLLQQRGACFAVVPPSSHGGQRSTQGALSSSIPTLAQAKHLLHQVVFLFLVVVAIGCSSSLHVHHESDASSEGASKERRDIKQSHDSAGTKATTTKNSSQKDGNQEKPWDSDEKYQQTQLALLEDILENRRRAAQDLQGPERKHAEELIDVLARDINERKQAMRHHSDDSLTNTSNARDRYTLGQIEILEKMRVEMEASIPHLDSTQQRRMTMFLEVLTDDIQRRKRRQSTHKSDTEERIARRNEEQGNRPSRTHHAAWNPRVRFYIPGTSETGEVHLQLSIGSNGERRHSLQFLDDCSNCSPLRDSISLSRQDISELQNGLQKLQEWSSQAQTMGVRKIFEKTAACFPIDRCGNSEGGPLTRVRFQIYEDGSTSGQIQVQKGRYQQPYNLTTENASVLRMYISRSVKEFEQSIKNSSLSREDLNEIFR